MTNLSGLAKYFPLRPGPNVARFFSLVYKAGATPSEASFRSWTLGSAPTLTHKQLD